MEKGINSIDKQYVVGIDVGGQTTKMGVVDARGQVLSQIVIRSDNHSDAESYLDEVAVALNKIIADAGVEGQ
ncbi:MAG: ROK family protein, partial [Rikenellaceae bacterium]|nr:ROK family protein [Rikenellaceae bacterium]